MKADYDYTSFELMAAAGARELKDGEIVGVGLGLPVVATVPMRAGGVIRRIKERPEVELWEVTRRNRDEMPARVLEWIEQRQPKEDSDVSPA